MLFVYLNIITCYISFMKYKLRKYQLRFLQGMILVTVLSLINSILVIEFELYGGKDHGFAIGFPLISFSIVYFAFIIYCLAHFMPHSKWLGVDSEYVAQNYPEIWKHIAPHQCRPLRDCLFFHAFIRSRYDDGKDDRLNHIKFEIKATQNIFGGGAFLLMLVEFISLFLHFLKMGPP